MLSELATLLETLNPTVGEISQFYKAWGSMPPAVSEVLLKAMEPEALKKIATWSTVFATTINAKGPAAIDPVIMENATQSSHVDDFFSTMKDAEYKGPKLDWDTLTAAADMITLAIKAEDWQQAVSTGMSLAKLIVL